MPIKSLVRAVASPVTAPMTGIDVPPASDICYETVYDGVDDGYKSGDAGLKIASGIQTMCCEFYVGTLSGVRQLIGSDGVNEGISMILVGSTLYADWRSSIATGSTNLGTVSANTWYTLVQSKDGNNLKSSLDGGTIATNAGGTLLAQTVDLSLGYKSTGIYYANARLRNIELYSGAATDITAWVPGDTSSLSGVSLVMQSEDGSGTDNGQGFTFTKTGDPTRQLCT